MNIFAIDLGNKNIKLKSARAEYNYPSAYIEEKQVTVGSAWKQEESKNHIFEWGEDRGNSFIWGDSLEIYGSPEKMIDTYARSNRFEQRKTKRLLEFAIARLAMDYDLSESEPLTVYLTLGLSITDVKQASGVIDNIKSFLAGEHQVVVDGKKVRVIIPSEDHLSIIPQYMGTMLELAFDNNLKQIPLFSDGRIGIVDIGGGTILTNKSVSLAPSPVGMERFEGIQTLIKQIASRVNTTKYFTINQLLKAGSKEDGTYLYQPNTNENEKKDITDIVLEEIESYTRFTVAPLITESFPDLEDIDFIVLTGGGAKLLDLDALLDEVGKDYFQHFYFVDSSEMANVRGFYKNGLLKWMNSEIEIDEGGEARKADAPTANKDDSLSNNKVSDGENSESTGEVQNYMNSVDELKQLHEQLVAFKTELDEKLK